MGNKKVNRVLYIYDELLKYKVVNKSEIAEKFGVDDKTIERDIKDLKFYLQTDDYSDQDSKIQYKRKIKGYILAKRSNEIVSREDALAVTKILLESRAFNNEELNHLINVILGQVDITQRKCIKEIIGNELFNYVPLKHGKNLLKMLWDLSELIRYKETISITYTRNDGSSVVRDIKPVAIIFSEFYFYLIAYIADRDYDSPTVFRVDRIKDYNRKNEKFRIPESERFEDGEFRKRVQFMYAGELMKIKFEFWGTSIDAVLERLPTAKVVDKIENKYIVEAEVYGKGIMMWILSQGSNIRILYPDDFVAMIVEEMRKLVKLYD